MCFKGNKRQLTVILKVQAQIFKHHLEIQTADDAFKERLESVNLQ